ncbi:MULTISPECIES: GumC family protein [unclassified Roseitalea]|uniref:GumC family protein n=1 Tax=unclassified Roseitalea TaxID=2639107 RepID=UPI00273E5464|nr:MULTISPECIES: GumC family protein [unclassified Roseitalea]
MRGDGDRDGTEGAGGHAPQRDDGERPDATGAPARPSHRSMPAQASPNGALIDPIAMVTTIWRWRWSIVAFTLVGAIIGVMVALSVPKRYTAWSEILIDPRELALIERDLEREFLANEAALAIIDSRLSLVTSRQVLDRVIERTDLDEDTEFNGQDEAGFDLFGGIDQIASLFAGEPPVEDTARTTLENLRDAITIDRTTRTFVINIGVESESPRKAALLANEVTRAFIDEQADITSDKARAANNALTSRLATLQADVEAAERRVEDFRNSNGLISTQGRLLTEDELNASSAQLAEARAATIRARSRAQAAQATTVEAVIEGSLPNDLITSALSTLRAQFAALRQEAAQLESELGPRHPRLASARASIEAARQDIAAELRRIVAGTQSELRQAVQTEQQLAAEVVRAKAEISNKSDALVTLRDLQSNAEAARAIYAGALLRARETGELEALGTVNASVLAEAEPPLNASSMSRRTIAMGFTIAGFLIGLGVAIMAGLVGSLRSTGLLGQKAGPDDTLTDGPGAGTRPQRSDTNPTEPMEPATMHSDYPPYPYAPYPHPQTAQGHHPTHSGEGAPAAYPAYPPQPAHGWSHPPAPVAPMPPHGYPAPHAVAAPAHHPDYGRPPYAAPMPAPAPWPHAPYPARADASHHMPQPDPRGHRSPAPVADAPGDDGELEDIRQALRDIREVVDELVARRDNVRRLG